MLHLNAGVDFNEVVLAAVHVVQVFHGARVAVVGLASQAQCRFAQLGAGGFIHVGGGGAFHHFLVAALDRAVALEQVHQVAVLVAQHLHFHVAGTAHQLFQVHLVIAKGGQGLALGQLHHGGQIGFGFNDAHATAATAPAGLEHQRIAHTQGHGLGGLDVGGQGACGGYHGHLGRHGHGAGGHFVAQGAHHVAFGANEGNACGSAGIGKVGVFAQKTVAGVNGIDVGLFGNADDVFNVQIGRNGLFARTHQVGLV